MRSKLHFIRPLYWISVVLGPFPYIIFKDNYRLGNILLSKFYPALLCGWYLGSYGISMWKRFQDAYPFTPNITDAILDCGSYTCITIASVTLITNNCYFYPKEIQQLLQKFQRIDALLANFHAEYKERVYTPHKKWFRIHIPILLIILVFNLLYTEIFWIKVITFEGNWGYTAANLQKIQLFATSMIMYNLALGLRYRFGYLNQCLEDIIINAKFEKDIILVGDNAKKAEGVNLLNQCHKQLLLMCAEFNKIFGTPILLLSATFIFNILHPINSTICQIMKGNVFEGVDVPNFGLHYIVMSVLSAFNTIVLVVPLAHACSSVIDESTLAIQFAENLTIQLSVFQYDRNVKEILHDMSSLASEVPSKYPMFTANGFYKVDHTMLFTLFGSVTTYLIVLIQINMLDTNEP